MAIEVIRTHTNIKGGVKNGKPYGSVDIDAEASIQEVECSVKLTSQSSIRELERLTSETLTGIVEDALSIAQHKFKSDIFGFGNAIHRSDKRIWRSLEKDWNSYFSVMPIEVNSNIRIRGIGTMSDTFKDRMEQ